MGALSNGSLPGTSRVARQADQGTDDEGNGAAGYHYDEEPQESEHVGKLPGEHAREHHAQGLYGGTDAEYGRALLPLGEIYQEEAVCREPKSVTELLEGNATVDDK